MAQSCQHLERFEEEVARAEIAGLQRQQQSARRCPRHRSTARRDRSRAPMRRLRTPSRDTTAPEVSPPATTSRRTPRATSPSAMRASASSISAPAASRPSRACSAATLSGGAGGGDHHRRVAELAADAQSSACVAQLRRRPALPADRVAAPAHGSRASPICASVAREHEPGQHRGMPVDMRQRGRIVASGSRPARRKFSGRPIATPEPPVISAWLRGGLADRDQMRVGDRIDDGVAAALLLQRASSRRGSPARPARRSRRAPARPCRRSGAPARAPGWRRSSASADGAPCRSRSAARRRRTDGPDRRCAHWPGRPGRRARSRSPAPRSAHRRPGRYCPGRCCRRSSSI